MNITVYDNGAAYMVEVDGLIVKACSSLGDAWRHIQWMFEVASQEFTVGQKRVPVRQWLVGMMKAGYLDEKHYLWMED